MSTNTSQNLGLHLWEPTDQVLRTEFNENWQKLDTAVNTAQQTAETQCKAGTYTGDGKTMAEGGQLIEIGFRPKFVIITRGWVNPNNMPQHFYAAGQAMDSSTNTVIQLESIGFRVGQDATMHYQLNTANIEYSYMVLK